MLKLFYYPGNGNLAPHMLLEELGVAYELCFVDRNAQAHKAADYLKLNPNGLIPVLIDGDLVLYETAAICLHLVDSHPQAHLFPALGTAARAHAYKWLIYLANTLHAELIHYYYPERITTDAAGAAQVKARTEARAGTMLDLIEAHFAAHGGEWLLGEHYSACDPYLFMLCRWTRTMQRPARALPQVGAFLTRMLARPAVQRMFEKEGLSAPFV